MTRTEMIERLEALRNKKTSADGSVTFDPFNEGDMALFRGMVQVLEALKAEEAPEPMTLEALLALMPIAIRKIQTLEDRVTALEKQCIAYSSHIQALYDRTRNAQKSGGAQ